MVKSNFDNLEVEQITAELFFGSGYKKALKDILEFATKKMVEKINNKLPVDKFYTGHLPFIRDNKFYHLKYFYVPSKPNYAYMDTRTVRFILGRGKDLSYIFPLLYEYKYIRLEQVASILYYAVFMAGDIDETSPVKSFILQLNKKMVKNWNINNLNKDNNNVYYKDVQHEIESLKATILIQKERMKELENTIESYKSLNSFLRKERAKAQFKELNISIPDSCYDEVFEELDKTL